MLTPKIGGGGVGVILFQKLGGELHYTRLQRPRNNKKRQSSITLLD